MVVSKKGGHKVRDTHWGCWNHAGDEIQLSGHRNSKARRNSERCFFTKVKQLEAIKNAENNMARVCDKRGV